MEAQVTSTDSFRLLPPDFYSQTPARVSTLETVEQAIMAFEGIGRGKRYEVFLETYEALESGHEFNFQSLAEGFARRVAGRHNKNLIFLLFGDVGSGKSMTLVSLAIGCAEWLAYLLGGVPEDYFSFEESIAIIDPDELQEKMSNLRKHGVYILDDAGPAYDARSSMSKDNKDLNYILQTARTQNNIILVSAPHSAMLDITARRIAQYYGETAEARHDIGLTFVKVFLLKRAMRENKVYYTYPTKGRMTAVRYYTDLPPAEIKKKYDTVRNEQALVIMQRRNERKEREAEKEEKSESRQTAADRFCEVLTAYAQSQELVNLETIIEKTTLSRNTVMAYMKRFKYEIDRPNTRAKGVIIKMSD